MEHDHTWRDQVNASGFPFQIRVAEEVRASIKVHAWNVIVPEHRWVNRDDKTDGFIDLVLQKNIGNLSCHMVIECKRVKSVVRP
jgi:hypothetical protein